MGIDSPIPTKSLIIYYNETEIFVKMLKNAKHIAKKRI